MSDRDYTKYIERLFSRIERLSRLSEKDAPDVIIGSEIGLVFHAALMVPGVREATIRMFLSLLVNQSFESYGEPLLDPMREPVLDPDYLPKRVSEEDIAACEAVGDKVDRVMEVAEENGHLEDLTTDQRVKFLAETVAEVVSKETNDPGMMESMIRGVASRGVSKGKKDQRDALSPFGVFAYLQKDIKSKGKKKGDE